MLRVAVTALFALVLLRVVGVLAALEAQIDAEAAAAVAQRAEAPTPPAVVRVIRVPVAAAPPPVALAAPIDGAFDSNWGPVRLHLDGARVTGDYDYNGGRIEGALTGNVLRYRWTEVGGGAGRGVWVVAASGELIGTWGAGDDELRGGGWNLVRPGAAPGEARRTGTP